MSSAIDATEPPVELKERLSRIVSNLRTKAEVIQDLITEICEQDDVNDDIKARAIAELLK